MRAVLLITAKDLRLGLRDRSVLLVGFVVPFALAALFSVIFGGVAEGDVDLRFLVVNEDVGDLGNVFVDDVLGGAATSGALSVDAIADRADGEAMVESGDADALFVVPAGFTDAVRAGGEATLEVIANVDSDLGRQVAAAIARGFAQELAGTQLAVAAVLAATGDEAPPVDELAQSVQETPRPITVVDGEVADNQLDQTTYLAAGMSVFFLFFTVQFGVLGLLEERRNGTLARLYSAPISRRSVLTAKTLTSFVLGAASMTVLMASSQLLLGADWGDIAGVGVLIVAGVASAVTVVVLVAALARTAQQAGTWQSIIAIVLGMAGGVFFDVSRGSPLLAKLSLLTPHQWFMRGLGELAGGGGVVAILPAVGAMLVFGAVVLLMAAAAHRLIPSRSEL